MTDYVEVFRIDRNKRLPEQNRIKAISEISAPRDRNSVSVPINNANPIHLYCMEKALSDDRKHTDFHKSIKDWFLDNAFAIEHPGMRLNITTDGKQAESWSDYLLYLVLQEHEKRNTGIVVEAYEENEARTKHPKALYYFFKTKDKVSERAKQIDHNADALYHYGKLIKNKEYDKISYILAMFGYIDAVRLDMENEKETVKSILYEIIEGKAKNVSSEISVGKDVYNYKRDPAQTFAAICDSKDLELRTILTVLLKNNVIMLAGDIYYFGDFRLGKSFDSIIMSLKEEEPEQVKIKSMLEAKYKEVLKG